MHTSEFIAVDEEMIFTGSFEFDVDASAPPPIHEMVTGVRAVPVRVTFEAAELSSRTVATIPAKAFENTGLEPAVRRLLMLQADRTELSLDTVRRAATGKVFKRDYGSDIAERFERIFATGVGNVRHLAPPPVVEKPVIASDACSIAVRLINAANAQAYRIVVRTRPHAVVAIDAHLDEKGRDEHIAKSDWDSLGVRFVKADADGEAIIPARVHLESSADFRRGNRVSVIDGTTFEPLGSATILIC